MEMLKIGVSPVARNILGGLKNDLLAQVKAIDGHLQLQVEKSLVSLAPREVDRTLLPVLLPLQHFFVEYDYDVDCDVDCCARVGSVEISNLD